MNLYFITATVVIAHIHSAPVAFSIRFSSQFNRIYFIHAVMNTYSKTGTYQRRWSDFQLDHFFGGRSKATASCSKWFLWDPSQKGLLLERPHRQSVTRSLPPRPYWFPFLSAISKSPVTISDPSLFTVIFVLDIAMLLGQDNRCSPDGQVI